jgi:aminopeptidase N
MKKTIALALTLLTLSSIAQEHPCAKHKQQSYKTRIEMEAKMAALSPQTSHEIKYDIKFVFLNLEMERNTKYIKGGVTTVATVTMAALDTFQTLLHLNHTIDSVRFNNQLVNVLRQDSMVKIKAPIPLNNGASFTVTIYYKGTAPSGGAAIGSGYNMGTSGAWGNQATWSLSESFVGYHWWPCKQILTDKIDSSWVFVTTDSTNKTGSNGILTNVVNVGNKKRYEWKSRTPINYYLISVATARYKEYNLYAHPQYLPNDSILIQNYIYNNAINNNNWINQQKPSLDQIPAMLEFLSEKYGMYPFYKEKYGNCMAPFGGGMEHQTMTSQGFFEYYINAHELGHHWWGDNVTCKSWGDIWINEGWASYTEHLVAEFLDPTNFAGNLNAVHNNIMSQPGGSVFFTGADTMNTGRIFSGRLTYDKGGAIVHSLRFLTNNDSLWFQTLRGFQNLYKDGNASAIDFQNYYQTQTGINPTQFFSQWYYGEGYPTFDIRYNFANGQFFLKSTQSVSMPGVTPLFITPIEYRITRSAMQDTIIRVMHSQAIENYTLPLIGNVTSVQCDPKNWLINKVQGSVRDQTLGINPDPVGLQEPQAGFDSMEIGPNPCKQLLTISGAAEGKGSYSLNDVNGKRIAEGPLQSQTQLDFSQLSAGVYMLVLKDMEGKTKRQQKIIRP